MALTKDQIIDEMSAIAREKSGTATTEDREIINLDDKESGMEFVVVSGKMTIYREFLKALKKKYPPDDMPVPADRIKGDHNPIWYTSNYKLFEELHNVGYVVKKSMAQDLVTANKMCKEIETLDKESQPHSDLYYYTESGSIVFNRSDIAEYLLNKFHALVVVGDKYMYIYNEDMGIYEIDYGAKFITELNDMFGDLIDIREINEIMSKVFYNIINKHSDLEDIWQDDRYINFKNGVYNIETKEKVPHSPDYHFLTQVPVNYNPDATCPNIEKLMGNVFTDDQLEDEYEWIGYCLTPGNRYKCFSIYIGATDSGRSTYFNLVEAMIGIKNTSALEPQELSQEFYIYELHNSMLNTCADVGSHKIKGFNKIKKLTGGDRMVANIKGKPLITFHNNCKLMWAANRMPTFDDSTSAAYNRLRQINCCKVIDESDQDGFNFDDYTTPEELSGLINLAIAGLERLNDRNKFNLPTIDERIDKHDVYATSLFNWAEDKLTFDKTGDLKIFGRDLYESYTEWCKQFGMNITISQTAFVQEFKNAFNREYNRYYNVTIEGKQMRGCSGVAFIDEVEFDDEGDFYTK